MAAGLILLPILDLNLLELSALLLQTLIELVLDLQHLALLLLLQSLFVVINVCTHLLSELLQTPISIFLRIFVHFLNIYCELLLCIIGFEELLVFEFTLLLAYQDLLLVCFVQIAKCISMLMIHLDFFIIKVRHDFAFHLLCRNFNILPSKLLLLEQA